MLRLPTNALQQLFIQGQGFTIPENVTGAIEESIITRDVTALNDEYSNLLTTYKNYREIMRPIEIDYHQDVTIDAYTIYYLPRNLGIPWIAFRDLSTHPAFQNFPDTINVLDFGSGTGAVSLGLLYLYNKVKPFVNGQVNIVAMDCCNQALTRQKKLIEKSHFKGNHLSLQSDLNDVSSSIEKAKKYGPFQFIFIANCFTELETEIARQYITELPSLIDDAGVIIIAEAQRTYMKRMVSILAKDAVNNGLYVFYPCPTLTCLSDEKRCWVWRDHDYVFPDITIDKSPLISAPKGKDLTLSWLILTKQVISLYDLYRKPNSTLTYGPIAQEWVVKNRIKEYQLGMCDGSDVLEFGVDKAISTAYNRGSVVGLSSDGSIKKYHELV